ncbi:hypothetical protein LXL04_022714 [Taraxacum kok-saghyz]
MKTSVDSHRLLPPHFVFSPGFRVFNWFGRSNAKGSSREGCARVLVLGAVGRRQKKGAPATGSGISGWVHTNHEEGCSRFMKMGASVHENEEYGLKALQGMNDRIMYLPLGIVDEGILIEKEIIGSSIGEEEEGRAEFGESRKLKDHQEATAPVLSQKRFTGSLILGTTPRSLMNSLSHIASFDASLAAMYSDSQVDSATVSCLELFQDTAPPFNKNTQPDCERASSRSVWKLASV